MRVHRPWVTEPGMWLQYDFGDGPVIDGVKTVLFCAWLAWSRFRVVLALRDKTMPSVFAALDVTLRRVGGAPTYVLTDNEKTVTVEHVAGIAVRNPQMVAFARHYGVTVHTCEPADPASKGGSESTVKLAKADLVPKDTNLLGEYASFAALEAACEAFCGQVNGRVHRVTRRVPAQMLAEEQARLHPLPAVPHTVAFGVTRTVAAKTPMVAFEGGQYSVPWTAARAAGLGPRPRHRRQTSRSSSCTSARPARSRSPAMPARRRAARSWTTSISRPPRPARSRGHRKPAPPRRPSSSPWVTGRGCGWPRRPRPAPGGCGSRWPPRSRPPGSPARPRSTGRSGTRRSAPASARATWPRSSITTPAAATGPDRRAGEDHSLAQGTASWAALGGTADGRGDGVTTATRTAARRPSLPRRVSRHRRRCLMTSRRCCGGCGCPTSAGTHRR